MLSNTSVSITFVSIPCRYSGPDHTSVIVSGQGGNESDGCPAEAPIPSSSGIMATCGKLVIRLKAERVVKRRNTISTFVSSPISSRASIATETGLEKKEKGWNRFNYKYEKLSQHFQT